MKHFLDAQPNYRTFVSRMSDYIIIGKSIYLHYTLYCLIWKIINIVPNK